MKNTLDLLRLTGKIIETWEGADIPEIEKDTVLENLRKIYGNVKYTGCTGTQPAQEITAEPAKVIEKETSITSVPAGPEFQPVVQPEPEPVIAAETRPEPATVEVEFELTGIPSAVGPDGTVEAPSCIVNSEDELEEVAENVLFAESEIPVKPKLDRRVILSLYGDEPAPLKQKKEEPVEVITPAPEPRIPAAEAVSQSPVAANISDNTEPVQVLGDVLNTGNQTVSDIYSEQAPRADVASVLSSGRVDGIRKAIGINDKFLIIRNLFDGSANDYDTVMTLLDEFDNLDDALIFIHENFDWNPDNDAVKLIVDLLTRKLS